MTAVRVVAATLLLAAVSCKSSAAANGHYAVRGEVEAVTGERDEARAVIHHEAIPSFKDRDGKASTMASMKMSFALGDGVRAEMLKPGSKVAVEFDVRYELGDPLVITKLTPLPPDTPLTLH
jgi:Cu/Ag efflux protein CusF